MSKEKPKEAIYVNRYFCCIDGKPHRAYYSAGRGMGYYYCFRHGFICTVTGELTLNEKRDCDRQLKDGEWERMSKLCGVNNDENDG